MSFCKCKKYLILVVIWEFIWFIPVYPVLCSNIGIRKNLFLKKASEYYYQNKLDKAISICLQILKEDPYDFDTLLDVVAMYIKKGLFYDAYPYAQRLVDKYPNKSEALINMAVVEIGLGKFHDAIKYLNIAKNIKDCPIFNIYLNKGIIFSKKGNLDVALKFYKKAEVLDPNNASLLFNMALLYDKEKDFKNALIYYQKYLTLYTTKIPTAEKKRIQNRIYLLMNYLR